MDEVTNIDRKVELKFIMFILATIPELQIFVEIQQTANDSGNSYR